MKLRTQKLILAFILGAATSAVVAYWMTYNLRKDLDWAVRRGIMVEARLMMCEQGK